MLIALGYFILRPNLEVLSLQQTFLRCVETMQLRSALDALLLIMFKTWDNATNTFDKVQRELFSCIQLVI